MESPQSGSAAEAAANSQENPVELLKSRMLHPKIRAQLVALHAAAEDSLRHTQSTHEPVRDSGGKLLYYDRRPYEPKSSVDVAASIDEGAETLLPGGLLVDGESQPSDDGVPRGWVNPMTGQVLNERQLSIVEAHEYGHRFRYVGVDGPFLRAFFGPGFDWDSMPYSPEDYRTDLEEWRRSCRERDAAYEKVPLAARVVASRRIPPPEPSFEEAREEAVGYLSSPHEIAERMSQLKNFFGFRADEEFTADHLRVARERYVGDTGMDNKMTAFLGAVTPEREPNFLRLINRAGI